MKLLDKVRPSFRYILLLIEMLLIRRWVITGSFDDLVSMILVITLLAVLAATEVTILAGYCYGIFRILAPILFSTIWASLMYQALIAGPSVKIIPRGGFWLATTLFLALNKSLLNARLHLDDPNGDRRFIDIFSGDNPYVRRPP